MEKKNKCVEIKVVTWQKDSHGLFDYESKNINICTLMTRENASIIRTEQETVLAKSPSENSTDGQLLANVTSRDGRYVLEVNPSSNDKTIDPFLIVRSLKDKSGQQKGHGLSAGEILKVGRVEHTILEVNNGQNTDSINDDYYTTHIFDKSLENQSKTCRICLGEDFSTAEDNILINPCNCKGSCEYMHLSCLKDWIKSKIMVKECETTIIYFWKRLECEVCKEPLPKRINFNGKIINLVDIITPPAPYLMMENITNDRKVSKGVVIIKGSLGNTVQIGRGHKCDVRISDISVSRHHANITFQDSKFMIFDNHSKFGSLILRPEKHIEINNERKAIQVGRTVISFVQKMSACMELKKKDNRNSCQVPIENQQSPTAVGKNDDCTGFNRAKSLYFPPNAQLNESKDMDIEEGTNQIEEEL